MTKIEEIVERAMSEVDPFLDCEDATREACLAVARAVVEEHVKELWHGQYSRQIFTDVKQGLERNFRELAAPFGGEGKPMTDNEPIGPRSCSRCAHGLRQHRLGWARFPNQYRCWCGCLGTADIATPTMVLGKPISRSLSGINWVGFTDEELASLPLEARER